MAFECRQACLLQAHIRQVSKARQRNRAQIKPLSTCVAYYMQQTIAWVVAIPSSRGRKGTALFDYTAPAAIS